MQLEECFLEMVCHARWVFNYCITRLSAETTQRYADDIALLQEGLKALSKPHSADDEILDIPAKVVAALCHGVGYLLLGEDILGKAPPTMHPFLDQTAASRRASSKQAQVMVVRWFINSGLVSIEELLGVIYGPETTVENYESDYEAHMAVAVSLCSEEPFYLGAHVTILRALLLHYCTTVFTADDIISHVTKINPTVSAELYTLEDTLLHWVRTVLNLVPSTPTVDYIRENVSDLYLNTNDGRVISLVIHYYRPDLIDLDEMHLIAQDENGVENTEDEEAPLAGWQRESNWSNIIHAGEVLGLWVGVFSEEVVTHGFCTLQLHVLRVVEELFAVLAVGAEERMETLLEEAEKNNESVSNPRISIDGGAGAAGQRNSLRESQLVITTHNKTHAKNNTLHPSSYGSPVDNSYASGVSVELDNDTSLVMITPATQYNNTTLMNNKNASSPSASPQRNALVLGDDDEDGDEDDNSGTAAVIAKSLVGSGNGFETLRSPEPAAAKAVDTLGEQRGASSSVHRQIFAESNSRPTSNTPTGAAPSPPKAAKKEEDAANADPLADQRVGDYNIVLTNMFLQGIAMPVKKRAAVAPPPPPPAPSSDIEDGPVMSDEPTFASPTASTTSSAPRNKPSTAPSNGNSYAAAGAVVNNSVNRSALHETQDLSQFIVKSSREGGVMVSQVYEVEPVMMGTKRPDDAEDADEVLVADGPQMAIGTSPVKTDNTRPNSHSLSRSKKRRDGEVDDDSASSPIINKSLQKLHTKPINKVTASSQRSNYMPSVVQGSIHKEGIADLITELKTMCAVPPPAAVTASSSAAAALPPRRTSHGHIGDVENDPLLTSHQRVKEQNKELRAALERQQALVAAFLAKVQQGLSDPSSFKEVVKQLGGGVGGVSPMSAANTSSQQSPSTSRLGRPTTHSIAVGASFAGTSLFQSGPSPSASPHGGGRESSLRSKLPKMRGDSEESYAAQSHNPYQCNEDGIPFANAAVGMNNKLVPALLSVSKLQSCYHSTDGAEGSSNIPTLHSAVTTGGHSNNVLLSTGTITGHRGPQAQQALPIVRSLGGTANNAGGGGGDAPAAAAAKPLRQHAPAVMDISIETLKANPPKDGRPKAIPPRLAQRLKQANEAIDAREGKTNTGNVIKIPPPGGAKGGAAADAHAPAGGIPKLPAVQRKSSLLGGGGPAAPAGGGPIPAVRTWNNKNNVTLALRLALLPGAMNKTTLENILTIIDRCEEDHSAQAHAMGGQLQYVILLKDEFAHAFKGLYMLKPDGMLTRLFGVGPMTAYGGPALATIAQTHPNVPPPSEAIVEAAAASAKLFPKFFKYDTSGKKFVVMAHKEANQTTDAVSFSKMTHKINRTQVM